MDKIIDELGKLDLSEVLRGVPLDVSKLPEEKLKILTHLAAHCVLNGPVGVNKNTNFPTGEVGSIKGLIGVAVTNSGWRELCRVIAEAITKMDRFREAIRMSSSFRRKGGLWPLSE
jgi:hypothetical protein